MSQKKDYYEGIDKDKGRLWVDGWFEKLFKKNGEWACATESSNYAKTMSPEYDSYHPYCCNTCKRGNLQGINLVRCAGCKIMKYCCKDHQKMDWLMHKQFCKAYTKVVSDDDDRIRSHAEWTRQQTETNMKLMRTMGGDLRHTNHIQISLLQPHCRRCYRSGRLTGVDLVVCPGCYGVAICKSCLGDEHVDGNTPWNTFHNGDKEECQSYLIHLCCSGMIIEQRSPLLAASDTNCTEMFHPQDWIEYFKRKETDFNKGTGMMIHLLRLMAPITCFLTDGLTLPMTLNMFLGKLDLLNKPKLCIHILGAESTEFMVTRLFVELGRLNPQLKRLDLVMVGPNLPFNKSYSYQDFTAPHEALCHLDGTLDYVPGLYHHSTAASGPPPDCYVAFNSGIDDPSHFVTWAPTMELVKRSGVPLCITGFTFLEVETAVNNLKRMDLREKIPPTANPFRSMRPFVDPSREETDFYYNCKAYAVVQGR